MSREVGKKVFISYAYPRDSADGKSVSSKADRIVAEQICSRLESAGIACWIAPRDISPGKRWLEAMIEGVNQCCILIVVFSAATNLSNWVTDEITLALEHDITIIPFKIEDVSPQGALEVLQVRCQWIDAYTPPLDKHIDRLVLAVHTQLVGEGKKQPQPREEVPQNPVLSQAPLKKKEISRPLKWITAATSIIALAGIAYFIQNLVTQESGQKPHSTTVEDPVKKQLDEPQVKKSPTEKKAEPGKRDQSGLKKDGRPRIPPNLKALRAKANVRIIKIIDGEDLYEADYGNGIIMVYIPPGEFKMGSNEGGADEKPLHDVYLDGYWMGKTEVTVEQFRLFAESTGYKTQAEKGDAAYIWIGDDWEKRSDINWRNPGFFQSDDHPVVCISWHDAAEYCNWLSGEKGPTFKLPTEAQWEKAARGSDGRKYPWGDHEPYYSGIYYANYSPDQDGFKYTAPVGSFPSGASPYGLLDMAGNVWEWCADWYDGEYYKDSPPRNPQGPPRGVRRIVRDGGWNFRAESMRCADRVRYGPSFRSCCFGFRLCQEV